MRVKITRRRRAAVVVIDQLILVPVVMIIQADAGGRHLEDGVVELREVAVDALGVAEVERGHVDCRGDGRVGGGGCRVIAVGGLRRDQAVGAGGLKLVEDVSERDGAVLGPELQIVEAVKFRVTAVIPVGDVDGDDAVVAMAAVASVLSVVGMVTGMTRGRQLDLS